MRTPLNTLQIVEPDESDDAGFERKVMYYCRRAIPHHGGATSPGRIEQVIRELLEIIAALER